VRGSGLVLKRNVAKLECFPRSQLNRMFRLRLHGQLQEFFKIGKRGFCFTIYIDHIAKFLQWSKDEEGINEKREELAHTNALRKDQVEHQEEDRSAQQVNASPLDKAQAAQVADFLQLEFEDFRRG